MELKRRLPAVLLLVSVVPMMIIGLITLDIAEREAAELAADKMDAIASIQEARLEEVMDRNLERFRLVSSRTQLRISLEQYTREGGDEDLLKMRRILVDARDSIPDFEEVSVLGLDGTVVASSDPTSEGTATLQAQHRKKALAEAFMDIVTDEQGAYHLRLVGPLVLENRTIGVAHIIAGMASIATVTQDRTGLEGSGETLLAMRGPAGEALFITPLRSGAFPASVPAELSDLPIMQALAGSEGTLISKVNYVGLSVLAATRHVDTTGWGLVVQVNAADVTRPIDDIRTKATIALFIFMMPLIAIALMTSHSISQPLVKLRTTLEDISMGNMEATIDPKLTGSRDEIGELARAFERMMVSLKLAMKLTAPELKRESDELRQALREKEEAERALKESEALLRATQEITHVGGWTYDVATGAVLWTDEVYRIHEMEPEPGIDHVAKSSDCYPPADRERVMTAFQRAVEKGIPYDLECRFVSVKGRKMWVRTTARAEVRDGKVVRVIGNIMDITERKQAEERMRDLLDNMSELVQSVTPDGTILYVNNAWAQALGYTKEEAEGMPVVDIIHPGSLAHYLELFNEVMQGKPITCMEATFVAKDGMEIKVTGSANARFEDGRPVATRGIFRTVNETGKKEKGES